MNVAILAAAVGLLVVPGPLVASAPAADNPTVRLSPPTTAPPVTTPPTTAAPQLGHPIDVPSNPYAPEPIVRFGTIEIPKIGLVHPLFEGVTLNNIDLGPSHWPGSAIPGQPGNAVFAGHRVTHTHPFGNIDKLAPGDTVTFTVNGVRSVYIVTGSQVVKPQDTFIVEQTAQRTATLFACHPPHSASFRYVVHLAYAPDSQ